MSLGHRPAAGNFSARYSRMASDSQTWMSPSINTGTLPVPETAPTCCLNSSVSKGISTSLKSSPATVIAIHGRNDQLEYFLLPMISVSIVTIPRRRGKMRGSPRRGK